MNTRDVENAVKFYRDVLGMEIQRLAEFRKGKVGFVSARVSSETFNRHTTLSHLLPPQ